MEKFKAIERETKQKPYSKDALAGSSKYDPQAKEEEELREWLQTCVTKLGEQLDDYENKLEDLNSNKKKRVDKEVKKKRMLNIKRFLFLFFLKKIVSTKTRIDTHKKHINTIDKLVNMLQDNQISYKKVLDLRESIDDYVERNNEPDFEEISDLFDDLELDKIAASMIFVFYPCLLVVNN